MDKIFISIAEESVDPADTFNRTAELKQMRVTDLVTLGKLCGNPDLQLDVAYQIDKAENPGSAKLIFMVDENYPERFTHISSATSCYSGEVIDIYYDKKTRNLIHTADMDMFDVEGNDSGIHVVIPYGVIASGAVIDGVKDLPSSTYLLNTGDIANQIILAKYALACAEQLVYLGKASDIFESGVNVKRLLPGNSTSGTFIDIGFRKEVDIYLRLNF